LVDVRNDPIIEYIILNKNAHQNPLIINPSTICEANNKHNVFIIIKNNPIVNIVIGNVNKIINGFTNILITTNVNAIIIAVLNVSIVTPGKRYAVNSNTKTEIVNLIIVFILFIFY